MVLPYIEKPYFCQELHLIEFSRIFSLTHISKKQSLFLVYWYYQKIFVDSANIALYK